MRKCTDLAIRLWRRVTKALGDGCWVWTGAVNERGYGVIGRGRRRNTNLLTHRASYELQFGPIPHGLFVCHRCDNPPCVRPDHLFLGTPKENVIDMVAKGRQSHAPRLHGEAHHRSKLTEQQVREIRAARAQGMPRAHVAQTFHISLDMVSRITTRRNWTHLKDDK